VASSFFAGIYSPEHAVHSLARSVRSFRLPLTAPVARRCSWCKTNGAHKELDVGLLGTLYYCITCKEPTKACLICSEAMAKATPPDDMPADAGKVRTLLTAHPPGSLDPHRMRVRMKQTRHVLSACALFDCLCAHSPTPKSSRSLKWRRSSTVTAQLRCATFAPVNSVLLEARHAPAVRTAS
jgi:hypothetical protein